MSKSCIQFTLNFNSSTTNISKYLEMGIFYFLGLEKSSKCFYEKISNSVSKCNRLGYLTQYCNILINGKFFLLSSQI